VTLWVNESVEIVRTSSGSTPASTLITARPGSSIWIDPEGPVTGAIPSQHDTIRLGSHGHRHQPGLCLLANTQGPLAILISPLEHLVCIYSMLSSHARNRCPWGKRGFYDATLLFRCPSQPLPGMGPRLNYNRIAHKVIVGQIRTSVYTAKSGRLRRKRQHRLKFRWLGCSCKSRSLFRFPAHEVDHLRENLRAIDVQLMPADLREIETA
jgi:hypothetical protein